MNQAAPIRHPKAAPSQPTLRSARELAAAGLIALGEAEGIAAVGERYAIAVTPAMAALMTPGDAADPIARQFLPDPRELSASPQESVDPIGDEAHSPVPGIVHRYPDRALVKMLHACPVYCRFCFRREMVGPGGEALSGAAFDRAMDYLAGQPGIWEVIVTGGDPFMLTPRRIGTLMSALGAMDHVRVVRWHTRVPMVDPGRVTPALVKALKTGGKATFVGIHANHPREFTPEARRALALLADAGIALVSQSVLLRGVNDEPATLAALMRAFVENRVQPYYLHHPDLAPGTAHFRLSITEGQALVKALRGYLSGLAQPTYVLDIPGGHGKAPIGPGFTEILPDGRLGVADRHGVVHAYPPSGPST